MAEQILIEFIADTAKLEPAIDVLKRLGHISDEFAGKISNIDKSSVESFHKETAAVIPTLDKVQKKTEELADTVIECVEEATDTVIENVAAFEKQHDAISESTANVVDFGKKMKDTGKTISDITKLIAEQSKKGVEGTKKLQDATSELEKKQDILLLALKRTNDPKLLEGYKKGLAEVNDMLSMLYEALDNMPPFPPDEVNEKVKSLAVQLRDVRAELAQMELDGKKNTEEYSKLSEEAGKLQGAISNAAKAARDVGSNTRNLDNLMQLTGGVAGGFAVAQGAAALFGKQNEEVQKALLKVNAAMAILQGLQQIQALLSKQQFASLAALVGLQKLQTAQTYLQTAAESKHVAVRWLAVAAQTALNAVMALSPTGAVFLAMAALVGTIALFANRTETAAEKQAKLNEQLRNEHEYLKAVNDELQRPYSQRIKAIENELTVMKAKGVKQEELIKKEKELAQVKLEKAGSSAGFYAAEINDLDKVNTLLNEQRDKLQALKKELDSSTNKGFWSGLFSTDRSKDDIQKDIDATKGYVDELTANVENATQIRDEYNKSSAENRAKQLEEERKQNEQIIKSFVAMQEGKIAAAKAGSVQELIAQKEAIRARFDAEIKLNKDLTSGEIFKMRAEALRQLQQLDSQIAIKKLEDEKSVIAKKLSQEKEGTVEYLKLQKELAQKQYEIEVNAFGITEAKKRELAALSKQQQQEYNRQITQRESEIELNAIRAKLAAVRQGSVEEFNLKVEEAKKQYDYDLNQKALTDDKKAVLEAEYVRKISELNKAYSIQVQQEAVQIKQSEINTKLNELALKNISQHNDEVRKLRKQAIEQRANAEILAAQSTITNEQVLAAKIKEIRTRSAAELRDIDVQEELYRLDQQSTSVVREIDLEIKRSEFKGASSREILKLEKKKVDEAYELNRISYRKELISYEEFRKKRDELDAKYSELELQRAKEKEDLRKEIINGGFQVLREGLAAIFESDSQNRQAALDEELNRMNVAKEKELADRNLTEQQKADIERKYDQKQRTLKRDAALKDKEAKISQAVINGLMAITQIMATTPFATWPFAIPLAIATSAIQVAKIKATPIPGFKKGTRNAPKGFAWVGEEGAELVQLNGGEKIYTYGESRKIAKAWERNNALSPTDILAGYLPHKADPEMLSGQTNAATQIDYEMLGKYVAKHLKGVIPSPTQVINNMDEEGFAKFIINASNKTEVRNKRFSV